VKLLLDDIVEHPDADCVLRTLEYFLREISLEIVRTEDELIVYGLGPSFRTMNPKDKTIVRATSEPSATTLHTEANFLASALAGNVAQDEIVRSKIERAFESLKTELSNGGASRHTVARALPTIEPTAPGPAIEAVPPIAKAIASAPVEVEETSPAPIDRTPDAVETTPIEVRPEPQSEPEPRPQPKPKIEGKPYPQVQQNPTPRIDTPILAAPPRSAPVPSALTMEEAPIRKRRSAILLVLPLLILLLAVGFYVLQHHGASQSLSAATPEGQTASTAVESKAAAPAPAPAPDPPASAATPAPPAPATMPTNIKAWVQAWAAAMSTRDAQAQLAFYSTPLDRYFLTSNVSKEKLLKNKQAEIDARKGTWTFKAEDLVIERQTPKTAVVYLNKHILVKLPSSASREERIKAQLKLKMIDGAWKITSERTVG
jgi:ketosteroid isomerase-like protein